jgi:DUF4097 and DUF4098 domain-containing protein YvlB
MTFNYESMSGNVNIVQNTTLELKEEVSKLKCSVNGGSKNTEHRSIGIYSDMVKSPTAGRFELPFEAN